MIYKAIYEVEIDDRIFGIPKPTPREQIELLAKYLQGLLEEDYPVVATLTYFEVVK